MSQVIDVFGYQIDGWPAAATNFAGLLLLGLLFAALVPLADAVFEEFNRDFGDLSDRRRVGCDDGSDRKASEGNEG